MTPNRLPGPISLERLPMSVDDGTMCRIPSPAASPTGHIEADSEPPGPQTGWNSKACRPETEEDKEVLRKVTRMRGFASSLGYDQAVAALDHYLAGSGEFVPIPPAKVKRVRGDSEASHKQKFTRAMKWHFGAPAMLALKGLVFNAGKAKPMSNWPRRVEFEMEYISGTAKGGASDDNLAYYGSMIKSVAKLACLHQPETRTYTCRILKWRSWVVDNYDWEGDKQFGGNMFTWLLPSQKQMNRLQAIGCSKSYQRSSRSWNMPHNVVPWPIEFTNDEHVELVARDRQTKNARAKVTRKKEAKGGALPTPGPAEKITGQNAR